MSYTRYKIQNTIYKQWGQSLIEAVIAIGIATMILVALVSGTVSSMRNARYSRSKTVATQYTQEGLEAVRSIRDRDFSLLVDGSWQLELSGGQWSFPGQGSSTIDEFSRVVEIADDPNLTGAKQITVTVSWIEGDKTEIVSLISLLSNTN